MFNDGEFGEYGEEWSHGQIGPQEHHLALWRFLQKERPDILICESFQFRQFDGNRTGIVLISNEYIGIAKLYAETFTEGSFKPQVVFQTASQGKGLMKDDKLKNLSLWFPGEQHARDAARHLVYYMVTKLGRNDIAAKMVGRK